MDDAFINGQEKLGETGFLGITFSILGAHQRDYHFVVGIDVQDRAGGRTVAEGFVAEKSLVCRHAVFAGAWIAFVKIGRPHAPGDVEFRVRPKAAQLHRQHLLKGLPGEEEGSAIGPLVEQFELRKP